MQGTQRGMLLRHPIMTIKHKLAGMGVDYAKHQQQKKLDDKVKAREKAAKEKIRRKIICAKNLPCGTSASGGFYMHFTPAS